MTTILAPPYSDQCCCSTPTMQSLPGWASVDNGNVIRAIQCGDCFRPILASNPRHPDHDRATHSFVGSSERCRQCNFTRNHVCHAC